MSMQSLMEDEFSNQLAAIKAQRDELLAALEALIALDDRFQDSDSTCENAYRCFCKGEYSTWENARAAIAKAKGGQL